MKSNKIISLRNNSFLYFITLVVLSMFQSCEQKTQFEIAEFRGPERTGIYNESNLLKEWPENGPELIWKYEGLGKGYAAPVVFNDKIFVNGEQDSTSFLFAFDLKGQLLWKTSNGKEFMGEGFSSTYPGSRSTPTVVNDLVYATSGMGRIACFETATGKELWAVNIVEDFGSEVPYFGYAESVIVDDEKVYSFVGDDKNNMVALNRFTGETVWSSEALKDTFSYCSPVLVNLTERSVIVTHSRHHIYAVDCSNGEVLGTYFWEGYEYDGEHCNPPVYADGSIYFIGNDEKGKGAIKLELGENGESLKEVWFNNKIMNNFNGYVKADNHLFTTVKGNWLKALADESGEVTDSVKVATGSMISADNMFFCYGMNGDMNLVQYKENEFKVTGNFKIREGDGQHFSHPVIKNGILYIRHGNTLVAYKIS